MSAISRLKASPGLLVRTVVTLGAVAAIAGAVVAFATGQATLGADALEGALPLAVYLLLLPCVVNGTFYLELALGRSLVWVDARLTARWEAAVYACSVGLGLGWLAIAPSHVDPSGFLAIGAVLVGAAVVSLSVIRRGVRADELALIQGLSQAIAGDISLARSFPRIQELARRLVRWEHMGFARYDPLTNEMELVADTAAHGQASFRFDANAGLTGEAVRLRRPVVARALAAEQVVVPGRDRRERVEPGLGPAHATRGRGRGRGRRDPGLGRRDGEDHRKDPPRDTKRGAPAQRSRGDHRGERSRGAPPPRRGRTGREVLGGDRIHRQSDELARPQRHDRSGARRRARPGLRGGRRRGSQARGGERPRGPQRRQVSAGDEARPRPGRPAARTGSRRPGRRRAKLDRLGAGPGPHR